MFLMDYKERTKAQLLQDIAEMHKQKGEWKVLERECRMQAEELQSLNEDINRKKKDLKILHTISNAVHQSFDLQYICEIALDIVITLKDVDLAFIYMVSEDRREAVLLAHRNLSDNYIRKAGRVPFGRGTTWKVINSGQVHNMRDIQKDTSIAPAGKNLGHHRSLGIPIMFEGVVMGVIFLASFNKGKFSEQEIELNVSIGNHIGIAIAKARLYEEMEARVKERTAELEETIIRLKNAEKKIKTVREQHEIVNAIKNMLVTEKLIDDSEKEITTKLLPHESLSNREYKVMIMIASGMSLKYIAKEMYLSDSTISTYRGRILSKLSLKTTVDLVRYTFRNNLIS